MFKAKPITRYHIQTIKLNAYPDLNYLKINIIVLKTPIWVDEPLTSSPSFQPIYR